MIIGITTRIYLEKVDKYMKWKDRYYYDDKETVRKKRITIWLLFIPVFYIDSCL